MISTFEYHLIDIKVIIWLIAKQTIYFCHIVSYLLINLVFKVWYVPMNKANLTCHRNKNKGIL